jgi:hypothetical protein
MKIQKNVYVVLTEYQLLQAINIATGVYADPAVVNIIYIVREGRRLMTIDANKIWNLSNLEIIILEKRTPKEIAELVLNESPTHFLFFQGGSALNVFLAHKLAKEGVEISLGPDGYGPYGIFNKRFHLLSVIKDSCKQNYYLWRNNLISGKIHRFDYYKYGNHRFINNLWITHPDQYKHRANNKVKILTLPDFNVVCINFIKKMFRFSNQFPIENVIYFFNQPLKSGVIEAEYSFVKEVLSAFPEKTLIIKLHPLTDTETKTFYKQLPQVQLIESNIPAEVLLLTLNNCIVFTGWSAVLITENKSCNYYFNFPIYKVLNDPSINQIDIVNLNHITMINTPNEMQFPHE